MKTSYALRAASLCSIALAAGLISPANAMPAFHSPELLLAQSAVGCRAEESLFVKTLRQPVLRPW